MGPNKYVVTAQAPVNIAVIKYWGKRDEKLKIPINDSLSGTLSTNELRTVTSVYISETYENDRLVLNTSEQELSDGCPAKEMLDDIRKLSPLNDERLKHKAHIISVNNFPTAAGLASSAAGYACLAYALGHAYGVTDITLLSKIARKGSGSACRSLFGGFVQWQAGQDHDSSVAKQIVDHSHWPEMRVVICVVNDEKKDVSSSSGMSQSVKTSSLLKYRAESVVPKRIDTIKEAILKKDFETFADITMKDSNQFHAICLDTFPPLFYLNDASRQIIKICSLVNSYYGRTKMAYTFDAGPNACIYMLEDFVDYFVEIVRYFFPRQDTTETFIKRGNFKNTQPDQKEFDSIIYYLKSKQVDIRKNDINYLIITSIGDGPRLLDDHLNEEPL